MEIFETAKTVRLRSSHARYLSAKDDRKKVRQSAKGSLQNAKWSVELVDGRSIRLRSCHGTYLGASACRFLMGIAGRKVFQSLPRNSEQHHSDNKKACCTEWEPIKLGFTVRLRSVAYGTFLKANSAPFLPLKKSVSHDVPKMAVTTKWTLWEIEVTEVVFHLSLLNRIANKDSKDEQDCNN